MSTDYSQSPYNDNGGRQRQYDVEPWRKWAYYGGIALQVVGFLAFVSVFVVFFTSFHSVAGNHSAFDTHFNRTVNAFPFAFVGILLMIGGQTLQKIGRKGLAGSGVILSPRERCATLSPGAARREPRTSSGLRRCPHWAGWAGAPSRRSVCAAGPAGTSRPRTPPSAPAAAPACSAGAGGAGRGCAFVDGVRSLNVMPRFFVRGGGMPRETRQSQRPSRTWSQTDEHGLGLGVVVRAQYLRQHSCCEEIALRSTLRLRSWPQR